MKQNKRNINVPLSGLPFSYIAVHNARAILSNYFFPLISIAFEFKNYLLNFVLKHDVQSIIEKKKYKKKINNIKIILSEFQGICC